MLERLEDDDDGLFSDDESYCEAEGISGYMPEADGGLLADISAGKRWMTRKKKAVWTLVLPLLQHSLLI